MPLQPPGVENKSPKRGLINRNSPGYFGLGRLAAWMVKATDTSVYTVFRVKDLSAQ